MKWSRLPAVVEATVCGRIAAPGVDKLSTCGSELRRSTVIGLCQGLKQQESNMDMLLNRIESSRPMGSEFNLSVIFAGDLW